MSLFTILMPLLAAAQQAPTGSHAPPYDLSKEKVLYCVGYAHLDTQWRWDFRTTIDKFIRDTLEHNFDRFEKYPGYVFNFTGSARYEMMKEYYPEHYERLKKYIAEGRWFISGSSVDEGDVNVPSAEAVIRHVLYGNEFFRREFGKESIDFMLPDCFGFPASMPSIWAHCGLKGFSTQKLTWGSAVGIPFKIGLWEGPDGRSVIAALDPGSYASGLKGRVDLNSEWAARIEENGKRYGVFADYHYYGVGDQGGAPREEDVKNYLAGVGNQDSLFKVALVSSDQMYKDITAEQRERLPRYKGDMLLTEHSAGTLSSQAYMKRWNRKGEILADAAERAAVAANWLGGTDDPREKLYKSWMRLLANQMHDILPGTSIPRAYTYSWNDELVAMNGFAAVLTDSVGAIARALNTNVQGVPLIVYNPLANDREDGVEATVRFEAGTGKKAVRVYGPDGREVPSQLLACDGDAMRILFLARTPAVSWSIFDVRPSDEAFVGEAVLRIEAGVLENEFYRVVVNENGDVASMIDKKAKAAATGEPTDKKAGGRELLASPAKLVFTHEKPRAWPAWNMDWADRQNAPIDAVKGPAKVRVVENGPVRVALDIVREARDSIIAQRIRLSRGEAGRRVEFDTHVDWQSTECALKASFPLAVANPKATYNWGMGTIDRGNNEPTKYEVPSHEWLDLTDKSGEYGVSILEDCKFGSDKPADNEVRLTLLYTPGVRDSYLDQHSQDWGRHEMLYALYGHEGDWRKGESEWQARRLNQPLLAFQTDRHEGPLGRSFGLVSVNSPQVDVRAVKLAERTHDIIVRVQELWGREAKNIELAIPGGVASAREVDGQERPIGDALIKAGKLVFNLTPYSPRSFALRLSMPPTTLKKPQSRPVSLEYNADVVSTDGKREDGRWDAEGRTVPAEMLPQRIISEGIEFELGPSAESRLNAVTCQGQVIALPKGDYDHLYLLAAADEDVTARLKAGEATRELSVQKWTGFVGQWDNRTWDREFGEVDHRCEGHVTGIEPGYIKRDTIAWFATHRHSPEKGNEAYLFSYLFKYAIALPLEAKALTLPDDPRIKIFALSLAKNPNEGVRPAAPLYDDFHGRGPLKLRHVYSPPPVPVFQGNDSIGAVKRDRKERFEDLSMGAPVATDYADQAGGHGIEFRYYDGDGEYRPHARSGAEAGALPRLNDGEAAQNDDDTARCVWYDNEGRFFVDLKQVLPIERINTYSWHRSDRAPQFFSLWGSSMEEMPSPAITNEKHPGWTLIAVVRTKDLGVGGVHGSSITAKDESKPLGPYRHLLFVAENVGQGTFFTEIDVHAAE